MLPSAPHAVLLLAFAAVAAGCGPAPQAAVPKRAGAPSLPKWDAHERDVFADNMDPAAVGLTLESSSARADRFLRERAQTADVVARVRVSTVTVDSVGDATTYHLGVQVGDPTLATPKVPDRAFELNITPRSGAYGIAKALDARLRGRTFIGFIRRFAGETGDPEIHWYLSPDTAEVAAAVKEAVILGELSGP